MGHPSGSGVLRRAARPRRCHAVQTGRGAARPHQEATFRPGRPRERGGIDAALLAVLVPPQPRPHLAPAGRQRRGGGQPVDVPAVPLPGPVECHRCPARRGGLARPAWSARRAQRQAQIQRRRNLQTYTTGESSRRNNAPTKYSANGPVYLAWGAAGAARSSGMSSPPRPNPANWPHLATRATTS